MPTISFIINPSSGTGKVKKIPALIHQYFKEHGGQYKIRYTEYAGHAKKIVNEEIAYGSTIIVAVGGDGTVNEVGAALLHSKASLGIIPTGSGNGLARHLKISMNAQKALSTITQGHPIAIDSGEVNGMPFFCTMGIGLDAVVAERFAHIKGRGFINYIKAAFSEYQKYKPEEVYDERGNVYRGILLSICNASQYGNNAFISPCSTMQDGQLELVTIPTLKWVQLPAVVVRLFSNHMEQQPGYKTTSFRQLTLKRASAGPLHVDGDPVAHAKIIDVRCVPRSLNVIVNS
jgi:diacylglycerol kinase (ATP)